MNDNYFSIEDSNSIISLYQQCQNLKSQQLKKLTEEIMICKEEIFRQSNMLYNFLNKLYNIIPKDNLKLKKKLIKHKWVKVILDQHTMTYQVHQDYYTYIIYNKILIPKIEQDLIKQSDIRSDFEAEIIAQIYNKNQKFSQAFFQPDPYSQNKMQLEVNNFSLNPIILYLNDIDDILTEQEFIDILKFMKIIMRKLFQNEYQEVADIIRKNFQEFIKNQVIEPCQLPQNLNYNDFGQGFEAAKQIVQQNKINEIKDNRDLNQLANGIYSIEKKKTIIILQISRYEKNAYIINEFEHYRQKNLIILDKLENFTLYKIRTIKLKIEEAYILIKTLKKRKQFEKQQNQTIEIYKKQDFETINRELIKQIDTFNNIQENIKQFIQKITKESNNFQDIYSLKFVQKLKDQIKFDLELIPLREFNENKFFFNQQILGELIIDKNKQQTIGVVVYLNKQKIMIFLKSEHLAQIEKQQNEQDQKVENTNQVQKNQQQINPNDIQNNIQSQWLNKVENSEKLILIQTNVKEIHPEVAQFYISLLLYKQENKVSKQIKDFLQLKNQVWGSILKFLF